MAESTKSELAPKVKAFQSLETHEAKCAFLHQEGNEALKSIYSAIHYPKPTEPKPA